MIDSVILTLKTINSLYCSLECNDYSVRKTISSHFSFTVPGYEYSEAHKRRGWDGVVSTYNANTKFFFNGSVNELYNLAQSEGWQIIDERAKRGFDLTDEECQEFYSTLNLNKLSVREHQHEAFKSIISNDGKGFYISPTSSGKSFIIFLTARFIKEATDGKTLVVVPTTHLVGQMAADFRSYTTDNLEIKQISAGVSKENIKESYVVTTWQSIKDMDQEWFDQFTCFIGDEGHGFTAASLKSILGKTGNIPIKAALTGTLRGCPVARLELEAFFGEITVVTTYQELLAKGYITPLKIRIMLFKHKQRMNFVKGSQGYKDELNYLAMHSARNEFIVDMTSKLDGNILIMVKDIDHGKILQEMLKEKYDRPIQFINGKVKTEIRLNTMSEMEGAKDGMIVIATFKSFGTGTSIRNVHHLIMADMIKSDETVIQTLGRLLRLHDSKDYAYLWDCADDLRVRKNSKNNYSLQHMISRCEAYDDIGFDYSIHERVI